VGERSRGHTEGRAWSTSFRLEPPQIVEASRPLLPSGGATAAVLGRWVGAADPRTLLLLALGGVLLVALLALPSELRPMALGLGALIPFVSVGTVFGVPVAPGVLLVGGSFLAQFAGASVVAGLLAGAATAMDATYVWPLPFLLLLGASRGRQAVQRMAFAATSAFLLLGLAPLSLGLRAFFEAMGSTGDLAPGLGLSNLLLYRGVENEPWARGLLAVLPLLVAVAVAAVVVARGRREDGGAAGSARLVLAAAAALLLALVLAPNASPDLVAVPICLAVLATVRQPA